MSVQLPIKKGVWSQKRGEEAVWVDFKYERLGDFCYVCGCLDHIDKGCRNKSVDSSKRMFGPDLKASQIRRVNRTSIIKRDS